MRAPFPLLCTTLAALAAAPLHAAEQDAQLWLMAVAKVRIAPATELQTDGGIRFSDHRDGLYVAYERVGISQDISDHISIGGGYGHFAVYSAGHPLGTENRLFEQAEIELGDGWSSRTQFEQRIGEGATVWRLRQRIGWRHGLGSGPNSVSLSGEANFGLNATGPGIPSGLQRLRGRAAVHMPIADHIAMDLGYIGQWTRRTGSSDEIAHAATIGLSANF